MASFSLWATFGLCLLKLCLTETQFNVSCRYGGVFHVEKNGRYSLTRSEAVELCRALNSTLSTLEQLKKAHELGFETCRYGFVVGYVVIPRINPYPLCAANHTGVYKLSANTSDRYDAYCYNETETREKTCEPIEGLDTSVLDTQGEIVIDNADGSRYNADGTRLGGESSTSGADDENVGSGSTHDTTPMDTSIKRSSPSYYGSATSVSHLPDHSSGGGEKESPKKDSDNEVSSVSPDISLMTTADDFPEKDGGHYPASTTPEPHHDNLEKATTQAQWSPFSNEWWWWSHPGEKTQESTQTTKADVTSSGNGSDDEDSSETSYPTAFPDWDRSVSKDEYAPSTTPEPHHDNLEKATTQAQWSPFSNEWWWWSHPGEKTQESTQTTKADVTSSGNGSDDEDSSETSYPTAFPDWDRSVSKDEYAPSTTPEPHHDNLEKATTQAQWSPFSNEWWWWSHPGEKTQESTQTTKADVTSSGNGSDDEDSSETSYPTAFPDWDRSVSKDEYAPSTTPEPHHDNLEKATTQAQWSPFSNEWWWWSHPGEKTQESTQTTKDVTSSGNGSDDEDSSETSYPTAFPDWDRSVSKDEYAPSTTPEPHHDNLEKATTQAQWSPFSNEWWWWSHPGEKTQESTQTTKAMDSQRETLLEISTQDHWNPAHTDEEEQYPSSAGRVTSENEKHQGPTQHPLLHSAHSGWISQEQNPANTTGSIKQSEITVTVENYIEKESSHTAMPSNHGAKQNNSVEDPVVYPGWDKGENHTTQAAVMDRIIPSRKNSNEKDSPATAVASPDGAPHEDRTHSPLPSDNEPGQGTEGITHPTDAPGDEVLHRTTASTNKADDGAPLTGTTVTASMGVLKPEDITQEVWAPHIMVTATASPDGAHHEDRTHSPLPSDNASGQGTESITHPTDAPGDEVLHRTTASMSKAGDDAPLTGTITQSMDDVKQEKTTKEPLVPGSPPGSDNEQENITRPHVNWIPGVFPDIEDHLNELQTPLPTRSTPSIYGNQGPHKGHYESTTSPAETTTTKITPQPRSASVPEWLIVVASLVALALILAVCIAVNSRRRCGQKKKLVINNGKGAVEDRKTSGLNGDASKSQEMVHLVHKEQSNDRTGACDEFLTVNETQNHQELDMKSGV
ncbi:CD44 antigen isoform X3 [Melopsittacus undulatus]|uniref:CD44 antigen isoform X3 n=1 Tax=Melopsittacus undulatus TaxID=13146 RepID=UPI00146EBAEE|nr:CD44 antigen isoform X3 [Melopsittacus undulatus]